MKHLKLFVRGIVVMSPVSLLFLIIWGVVEEQNPIAIWALRIFMGIIVLGGLYFIGLITSE